jgi:hypothetical protein
MEGGVHFDHARGAAPEPAREERRERPERRTPQAGANLLQPVLRTGAPSEPNKIRRAVGSAGTAHAAAPAPTKIRVHRDSPLTIRRVITDKEWTDEVTPRLDRGATVTVWKDGEPFQIRMEGDKVQMFVVSLQEFKTINAGQIAKVKAVSTLAPAHVTAEPAYTPKPTSGPGFTVTEFPNEPLSMVHHTESTGAEKQPHLTVENAHVLAFEDLFNSTTRDVRPKADLDKGKIKTEMAKTFGVADVDNLNFYQSEDNSPNQKQKNKKHVKEADKTPHERLPLSGYLAFLSHALTVGGAPAAYGQKITSFAERMAADKKLDTAQLFMRAGMDEPAFVRAVLIIDSQLPGGHKLAISVPTRKVFEKWWNIAGNDPKVPYLPPPEKKDGPATLRSGMQHGTSSFSKIEIDYCQEHFEEFVTAINAFVPQAEDVAEVGKKPKKTGKDK